MQRLTEIRKRENDPDYINLLSLYILAQEYVDKKMRQASKEEYKWLQIQCCLRKMKFFIDGESVPNKEQKKNLSLAFILGKDIYEVAEYAALCQLDMAFNNLTN